MEFKWFSKPSVYFKANPDLLRDKQVVSSFLSDLMDLDEAITNSPNLNIIQILMEIDGEVKWLKENRQDFHLDKDSTIDDVHGWLISLLNR